LFFFFTASILSFLFALLSRGVDISKVSLFGTPILVVLLSGFVAFSIQRKNELRKEYQAREKGISEKIKKEAEQSRKTAEQGATANP
jgi:hypothetical protein